MKTFLLAAVAGCTWLVGSGATLASPGLSNGCIARAERAEKVVAMPSQPQDCCTARLQCGQYLSTATVLRPGHSRRT